MKFQNREILKIMQSLSFNDLHNISNTTDSGYKNDTKYHSNNKNITEIDKSFPFFLHKVSLQTLTRCHCHITTSNCWLPFSFVCFILNSESFCGQFHSINKQKLRRSVLMQLV